MYRHLKEKQKHQLREVMYDDFLTLNLVCMFDYDFGEDEIDKAFVECNLIKRGKVGFVKYKGKVTACRVDPYGTEKTSYYIPKRWTYYIPCDTGEKVGTFENGKDGVVVWNNSTKVPDIILDNFNELLANTNYSMLTNLKWARLAPIVTTHDSKTAGKINSVIKNIENGQTTTIIDDNFVDSLLVNGEYKNIDLLNLTDVKDIDKLKYLCEFYEFTLKQYYTMYGQSMQTVNKRAQVNTDEIHGMDSISTIIPNDRLFTRQQGLDKVNEIFGTSYSVDFNESFKVPIEDALTETDEDETEIETNESEGESDAD